MLNDNNNKENLALTQRNIEVAATTTTRKERKTDT